MKYYISEKDVQGKKIALEDTILTTDFPTTAGSKMLDGYMSLFGATVIDKLSAAGYAVAGKVNVGEFAADFLGETSYYGACTDKDGYLVGAASAVLDETDATAVVGLDTNGTVRRAAALGNKIAVKPTYGTVSRFGTIPVACSGEVVSVTAKTVADAAAVLDVIAGHDDKDGTSLPAEKCALLNSSASFAPAKKVAVAKTLLASADADTQAKVAAFVKVLQEKGIEIVEIDDSLLPAARIAWNILFSAELCNNVSRYDGVKFGYRTKNYTNIDELYTNSRTETFSSWLKTVLLYGSEVLSTENYMRVYDKALRVRRVLVEKFAEIFSACDALILPACTSVAYTPCGIADRKNIAFEENMFTAPASITGLPAVVVGGVQLMGEAFSENRLLDLAKLYESKEA